MAPQPKSNYPEMSSEEDEPEPVPKKSDFSSVVGNGGEVDSEDENTEANGDDPTETGSKGAPDDDDFADDENVTLVSALQDADSRQKLTSRLSAPDVVAGEEEARRNAVDAEGAASNGGKASTRQAEHVPATVDPKLLEASDRAIMKTSGPGWDWVKVDMSATEHGVLPKPEMLIDVDMSLLRRHGDSRRDKQEKFFSTHNNGSRLISQAIILRTNQPDGDEDAKPKKLMIVPVQISDPPQDDKADLNGYATMMSIEPDVVRKIYNRDSTSRTLPSDFHPDLVDYVSLPSAIDFSAFVANHPKWTTLVSKKQSRTKSGGKRSKPSAADSQEFPPPCADAADAASAVAAAAEPPPAKKSKPETQRTMNDFVGAGSTAPAQPQDGANEPPVALSPAEGKHLKTDAFQVSAPDRLAFLPVQILPLPQGTTHVRVSISYYGA